VSEPYPDTLDEGEVVEFTPACRPRGNLLHATKLHKPAPSRGLPPFRAAICNGTLKRDMDWELHPSGDVTCRGCNFELMCLRQRYEEGK